MKSSLVILLLLCANVLSAQELKGAEKRDVKSQLREMEKRDQEFRIQIRQKPSEKDSLWKLQSVNDSINKIQFIHLIGKHGYPAQERVGIPTTIFLTLHFTLENDFRDLQDIFGQELKAGRMPALEYARWYDRCQMNMHSESMFGAYGKKEFCGEELQRVNENRATIGLPVLSASSDCP